MIIREVTKWEFQDAFRDMGRENQFSIKALNALYNYLDGLSNDFGEPIELDVIALCCDYVEYSDFEELQTDYPDVKSIEDLYNHTSVVSENPLVIQQF